MRIRPVFWLWLIAFPSLFSCETEVTIPFPEHSPRLVVFGYIEPDSQVRVLVGRSFGFNEDFGPGDLVITDATVELLVNGVWVETIPYRDTVLTDVRNPASNETIAVGRYESRYRASAQPVTFTLRVSHPQYGTATASAWLVSPPVVRGIGLFQNRVVVSDPLNPAESRRYALFRIELADNGADVNAYSFDIDAFFLEPGRPDTVGRLFEPLFPALVSGNGYSVSPDFFVLDTAWNGRTVTLDFLINFENFQGPRQDTLDWKEIRIGVDAINPAEARFRRKRELQQLSGDILFFPPEPVVVDGNVTGGYGLLSARRRATFTFGR